MAGGFKLQKWTTNDQEILSNISIDRHAKTSARLLNGHPLFKALGIAWQPNSDTFVFSTSRKKDNSPFTKRTVLSRIAQLFDPLGWLAPVTIRAKILMQDLWLAKIGWDEKLPDNLSHLWLQFLEQLEDISLISIPRWLGTSSNMITVEIHGFSDASQYAMAAVLYIRVIYDLDNLQTTLLRAKTKVSPLKRMTIPRLELTAAAILTREAAHVRDILGLAHAPIHLWTDSSVTLTWIKGHPSRWKDYVHNRVTYIQKTLPQAHWHHVPGKKNPADCASRGLTPHQLKEDNLWWKGPQWLTHQSTLWPTSTPALDPDINLEERVKIVTTTRAQVYPNLWNLAERYSSLTRLLRITATCRRLFSQNFRSPRHHPLTPLELETERLFWVKMTQQAYFSTELATLSQGHSLTNSNTLIKLIPFLDSEGLLRVGGRLRNSLLDPETKHPLILPKNSALTSLIIANAHEKSLHGGTQATLAYIRRSYWILGGRTPVRSFILHCVRCARHRGITAQQLMGQLPTARTTPSRPFLNSGIDYAGPFTMKTWRGRAAKSYKGYIVVFVCFSTSAVHLEVVTDYTAEGFIAAYKRFTGRRGICATLSSDCGTNLVGADSELRKLFKQQSEELRKLSTLLANDGTEWRFNPPSAPHFGGKWEAAVKSVKFHLRRIIGDTALTYEELSTLLAQIEAVLNSRPLCPLSDDPTDVTALTPGHFLIGSALTTIPEPSILDIPVSRLSRWQLLRQMLENFWFRWSSEYLQRFQSISKWKQETDPIKIGSLVLIKDERYPPAKWPLGRVIEVHPGPDNLIRVVTIKTQESTFKRPIVKLCPLPVH